MSDSDTKEIGPLKYFIWGGFGGFVSVLVGHPFDTIKVRLQTSTEYKGTLDCIKTTLKNEGIYGFYKGMSAPLAGVAPIFALSIMSYKIGKELFGTETSPGKIRLFDHFTAGFFSGIITTIIMAPAERVKCLLQIQNESKTIKYKGSIDCLKQLYKEGGTRSIYKGTVATISRDAPSSGIYFMTYEAVKNILKTYGYASDNVLGTIFAGGMSGVTFWIVGLPCDVVKNRYQTAPDGMYPNGVIDIIRQLLKNEGPLAFYKGIIPVLMRSFPANAACFFGFEASKQLINKLSKNGIAPTNY